MHGTDTTWKWLITLYYLFLFSSAKKTEYHTTIYVLWKFPQLFFTLAIIAICHKGAT